VTRNIDLART